MKKTLITILFAAFIAVSVFGQDQLKILQSYVEQNNTKSFYNLIKVSDTLFLVLKDTTALLAGEGADSQQALRSYVRNWVTNKSMAKDGRDYFFISKENFASIEPGEKLALNGLEFAAGNVEYKMRWQTPYQATIMTDLGEGQANVTMRAILYCCSNHKPVDCNEVAEKLKSDCTGVKPRVH